MEFQGKTVIITGAANGIGKAAALQLGALGANVAVVDLLGSAGEEVAQAIRESGGKSIFVPTNVGNSSDCQQMVEQTVLAFGRLDMAFNNAGTVAMGTKLADETEEVFDRVQAVNLKGVFLCMKYEIAAMLKTGGGAIVNTSSSAGVTGVPGLASYAASKHGVIGLTKVAALDYARQGIRVNAVCPGGIDTRMYQSIKHLVDIDTMNPMGRPGTPDELANIAILLLSDRASFVTGAVYNADGGLTAT